ncbi:aa3-type cytochrome c oxidase subunit IV [Erythrobacter insulae]|nr:aa3-type cytochrome c oxidase subunit IV [Erythrobacter insulae]
MATNDIEKARATYSSFMGVLKWAVPLIAIITLFVITLIAD